MELSLDLCVRDRGISRPTEAGPKKGRVLIVYRLVWPGAVNSGAGDPHSGKR